MTLKDAIEEVKKWQLMDDHDAMDVSFREATVIATILNAVVKGELK